MWNALGIIAEVALLLGIAAVGLATVALCGVAMWRLAKWGQTHLSRPRVSATVQPPPARSHDPKV